MPRRARIRIAGVPWHVVHRGHNRAACFGNPGDYAFYLNCLGELCQDHRCGVHAYVLMSNHVHLLMTPEDQDGVSRVMKALAQRASRRFNLARGRTGALWGGRFHSSIVQTSTYLLNCYRYIESNPVRAGMVAHAVDYAWSSYRANAEGVQSPLIIPHEEFLGMGNDERERCEAYRDLFSVPLSPGQLAFIRSRSRGGFVIGNPDFEYQVARISGLVARPIRRK